MTRKIDIAGLRCKVAPCPGSFRIAYMLYPMDLPSEWMLRSARHYDVNIVAISGMDWDNDLTPWPAAGVPQGEPAFKGEADSFLELVRRQVVPRAESALELPPESFAPDKEDRETTDAECLTKEHEPAVTRTLIGVSLSGLFTLWQWTRCDTFDNIACLSGSFWYDGFADWITSRKMPVKTGRAFFLLGERESHTRVKTFQTVRTDTDRIIAYLRQCGINLTYRLVPGDHYASPIPRLEAAFTYLFG